MTAKSSTNMMPVQRERDRAGQHLLFMAGVRSKLAKKGGDALSDLAHGDVERDGRYPAPAEIGTGGELVPSAPELRDTVTNPDYVAVDASRDRLALANLAGVLELALDASDTVAPKNSLEKMLVHQLAVLHRQMMKLAARMDDFVLPIYRPSTKDRGSLSSWLGGGPSGGIVSVWLARLATCPLRRQAGRYGPARACR